ncbi:MAG TPA: hypothetical protein VH859_00835 [Candidatus Limnocylindria bacterium]
MTEREMRDEGQRHPQHWYGWGSPVGLGIGVLAMVGAFALLAFGLTLLVSIQ